MDRSQPTVVARFRRIGRRVGRYVLALTTLCLIAVDPVLAQSAGAAFCETALAQTIMNLIGVIQVGGPLVGGLVAIGSVAVMPMVRRSDMKREIKELRNQSLIWGVIVAPLGTTILQFLLGNVVAGAQACGF